VGLRELARFFAASVAAVCRVRTAAAAAAASIKYPK